MMYREKGIMDDIKIPGVNILTRRAVVRPYGVFDFSTGWRFKTKNIEAEFGYNIWGKSNERVKLRSPLNHPCECFGEFGIAGRSFNTTASKSTISMRAENDTLEDNPTFISIKDTDIDLLSAASGSVLNHKVHVAFGGFIHGKNAAGFFGGGASIDMPQKNTSLRVWSVWATCGASF